MNFGKKKKKKNKKNKKKKKKYFMLTRIKYALLMLNIKCRMNIYIYI